VRQTVALTFDDGPDPRGTPAVLRALEAMHDGVGPGALRDDCRATADLIAPLAALLAARCWRPGLLDPESPWTC
jgi:hypothetical protein